MLPSCISAAKCRWWPAAASDILTFTCCSDITFEYTLWFAIHNLHTFTESISVICLSIATLLHRKPTSRMISLDSCVLKATIKETPCVTCVRKLHRCNRIIRWIGSGVSRDAYSLLQRIRLPHAFLPGLWCLYTEMFIIASQDTTLFNLFFFIDFWFGVINTQQIYFTSSTN